MSGTAPIGTPITSLPTATSVGEADVLLVLQVDAGASPSAMVARLLPLSVLATALQTTPTAFAAALTAALVNLPTTPPSTAGQVWNDSGGISVS